MKEGLLMQADEVTVDFDTPDGLLRVLDRLHLRVGCGEVLGLVGESGSGKSMFARTVMRLLPGNARVSKDARIRLRTTDKVMDVFSLRGRGLRLVRGGVVSMVLQEPMAGFAPSVRVGDHLVESLRLHRRLSPKQARKEGIEWFERVGIPEAERRFDQYAFQLSGGLRQRAMIALALATGPKLLIADEPTTALDVTLQAQILDEMLRLRRELEMSMIFITHDMGVIARVSDRVAVLRRGQVLETGSTSQVLNRPSHEYTLGLIESLPSLDSVADKPDPNPGRPLVSVEDLVVGFPVPGRREPRVVLGPVSMELVEGRIIGLVGESGSGKTTLGKALLGAVPLLEGRIRYQAEPPLSLVPGRPAPRKLLARLAQMVFQDPYGSLNPRLRVKDIIAEPLEALKLARNRREMDQRVREMARVCRIEPAHLERYPHALSGGQRQRVGVARALVPGPRFLVADEAVASLDASIQREILGLLRQLNLEMGLTILFITHDLSVVGDLCDEVLVLRRGRLVEQGSVKRVFLAPQEHYTRSLLAAVPTLRGRELLAV